MNPLVLAIDTAHEFGSIALVRGIDTADEVLLHAPEGFGHILYSYLDGLLARSGLKPADIDCFAAASGPGSFTGVRIALACIKGLAHATGKPAVGVSTLQALSYFGTAPLRAVLLDARRGEVYGAVYDDEGRIVSPETVGRFGAWLETVPREAEFIGPDLSPFGAALSGRRSTQAPRAQAAAIGRIAARRFSAGEAQDPSEIDANYVRRSDAEMMWRE